MIRQHCKSSGCRNSFRARLLHPFCRRCHLLEKGYPRVVATRERRSPRINTKRRKSTPINVPKQPKMKPREKGTF